MTADPPTPRDPRYCGCWHQLSRHGPMGCRYCACTRRPLSIEEAVESVASHLEATGNRDLASALRLKATADRATPKEQP